MSDLFYAKLADERLDEVIRLRAENEKLRAALKPFAADTRWLDGEDDDYLCSSIWFRLGQYRAAAAALKETE